MRKENIDDLIIKEAELIQQRNAKIENAVNALKQSKMTWSDHFFYWWENKFIPLFWIAIFIIIILIALGVLPQA